MTYKLYLGDCLEIMQTIKSGSIDAIITDLPYGTTACKWDTVIPFEPMWKEAKRVLKPNGVFATTASQPFTSALIMSNIDMFKYEWIWEKPKATGHASCNSRPMKAHENIVIFGGNTYNPQKTIGTPYKGRNKIGYPESKVFSTGQGNRNDNNGFRYPRTVIKINNSYYSEKQNHPTQKPIALYEYLIRTYTNECDTVLDICMGSGTTIVSAIRTGRNAIGIEMDKEYFEIAKNRIEFQSQLGNIETQKELL